MAEKRDRKKHPERECGEPWIDWTWARFPGTPPNGKRFDIELEAEQETDRDLTKSIPQLVCDFNFEAQKAKQMSAFDEPQRMVLRAQARMVAMMAQVAMKNDKVSEQMIWFNRIIAVLTGVLVILTLVLLFKS